MYSVIIGDLDAPTLATDFSTFGPFETKEAADAFVVEWFDVVGEDNDTAIVVPLLDPNKELAHERKELAEIDGRRRYPE